MGFEKSGPGGTFNQYGPRQSNEGKTGGVPSVGATKEAVVHLNGEYLASEDKLGVAVIPAGSKILRWHLDVNEAFDLGGTNPTIDIGEDGDEATNGFSISEAQAEAEGVTTAETFNGTFVNELDTDVTLGVALGGTSPTVEDATVGEARVVIEYIRL